MREGSCGGAEGGGMLAIHRGALVKGVSSMLYGIIGLVIFVLDVIAIVDVLKSGMDTAKKLLWIVVILLLPLIGMVAYFLIGGK